MNTNNPNEQNPYRAPASIGAGSGQQQGTTGVNIVLLIVSWLWVGAPLLWGVSQTVINSLPLFRGVVGK